ncbi:MAG: B12-binding domain-containing radical SAM protein [Promethearchaeota archaeon]
MGGRKNNLILLVRPRINLNTFSMPNPPLGLGYLSSYMKRAGFRVFIVDMTIKNVSMDTLIAFIEKNRPLLVGISALTAYYNGLRDLSIQIKSRVKQVTVVLGGVHVSSIPEVSLDETNADFIVENEGEETLLDLAEALARGEESFSEIKGLWYRAPDGTPVHTGERPLLDDINSIPFPDWEQIKPSLYPPFPHGFFYKHSGYAPIFSSRGCPFSCHYCASCNFWRRKIRFRTPENVVDEIQFLHDRYGVREIHFWDDNLTLKRSHIEGICKEIMRRNLHHMHFSTPNGVRVDTLDEKLLKLMRAAGFYHLTFSVESGSSTVLKKSGKFTNLKLIARNAFIAKRLGFDLESFFLIGLPADTVESIKKTIKFAKSVPFDRRNFFLVTPLPGSRLFSEWAKNRDVRGLNWESINFYNADMKLSDIDKKTLEKWQRKAFKETLLRLKDFLRFIFIRFIKYGHFKQYPHTFRRMAWLLLKRKKT